MFDRFVRLFIKDSDVKREKYGKFAAVLGIISNCVLFVAKVILGLVSSSVSIIADAINNLADAASSIVTLIAFKIAGKPADKEHPYGHARIEYIAGMIVSFMIILIGWQLCQSSIDKIISGEESLYSLPVLIGLAITVIVKLWQGFLYRHIAKKISSTTLSANATDSFNDVISTSAVLVGAGISYFSDYDLDGIFGMAVALFIIYSGIRLVIETAKPLLGEAPKNEMVGEIREKVLDYEGVIGVHDLMVHSYGGGRIFASLHCEVDRNTDVIESHDLMDNIERDFYDNMGIHMVIHMDPVITDDEVANKLKDKLRHNICNRYPCSSIHDFRVVWGKDHSNIVFDICIPFSQAETNEEIKKYIENQLKKINPDYRLKLTIDRMA